MHLTTTCLLVFAVAVALCSAAEEPPKNVERRDNTGAKQQLEQQLNEAKQPSGMAKDVYVFSAEHGLQLSALGVGLKGVRFA